MITYKVANDICVFKLLNGVVTECTDINDSEYLAWLAEGNTPSEADPLPELTYAQKRQAEYPPMADYLDAIVKGDLAQQQAYIDACLAIKAKYPKS